jgi:hypothetical protein
MSYTLESVLEAFEHPDYKPKFIDIDEDKIEQVVRIMAGDVKDVDRTWHWPPHIIDKPELLWPLLAVQNIVNFRGWKIDEDSGEKGTFTIEYGVDRKTGQPKRLFGAAAIMACITRAYEDGKDILNPAYLKNLTKKEAEEIFSGEFEITRPDGSKVYVEEMVVPSLGTRLDFLRNLGKNVEEMGGFEKMVEISKGFAFKDNGTGLVQLLAKAKGYNDVAFHEPTGKLLEFYKKAQLAVIMGYESGAIPKILGKEGEGIGALKDIDNLSVAADYLLPAFAIYTGMIKVKDEKLMQMLQNSELIEPGSLLEQEIRMATVIVGNKLAGHIGCNEYKVDYPWFWQTRSKCRRIGTPEQVCTTDYGTPGERGHVAKCGYTDICASMKDSELAKVKLPRIKGDNY